MSTRGAYYNFAGVSGPPTETTFLPQESPGVLVTAAGRASLAGGGSAGLVRGVVEAANPNMGAFLAHPNTVFFEVAVTRYRATPQPRRSIWITLDSWHSTE